MASCVQRIADSFGRLETVAGQGDDDRLANSGRSSETGVGHGRGRLNEQTLCEQSPKGSTDAGVGDLDDVATGLADRREDLP